MCLTQAIKDDAFGNEKNIDNNDTNVFRYSGEYFDKETGTIYLRARYYDPATSRMLTEDSYTGDPKDPLSLNLYTYCHNDPVNYIDPTGHWEQGDNNYCMAIQTQLLKLTLMWYLADENSRGEIHAEAQRIRDLYSQTGYQVLNSLKKITEAAANEFSWFLGGSYSKWERNYMLDIVSQYQSGITVSEDTKLKATMFLAGFISPTGKLESWIARETYREIGGKLGKEAAEKFGKAMAKGIVGDVGENGIKYLGKEGMEVAGKIYRYEIKIKGKYGDWRVYGNKNDQGQIIFDLFGKGNH
ncbi:MAG: RHS repeat-associated core domain-containing protein [Ruminiclostridium sp.]|nr:RHS repeat-associated core domain-containing protein [Ruminiclostridium sp.]